MEEEIKKTASVCVCVCVQVCVCVGCLLFVAANQASK